jgi:AraC-like DNA-binding protein
MNISPTHILFVLIIFQLLFLSIFLLTQEKRKRPGNILLGLFFLSICFNLLDVFLFQTGVYKSNPQMAGWGSCLPLLFGPFIYFYTQSVTSKNFTISYKSGLHFLPFLVLFAVTEFYYLRQPRGVQEQFLSALSQYHLPASLSIVSTLIFVQFLSYVLASLRLVNRYKKASGQYFSDTKNRDVTWLYAMLIFFIAIIIISALNGLFAQTNLVKYYLLVFNFVILAMLVFIIRVLLKALRKPYFYPFSGEEGPRDKLPLSTKSKIHKTENSEAHQTEQILLQYMASNKPFLAPELTLDQLALQLSLRPRVLSQVINDRLGQNFYDFINRYRIQEASRLLTNPKDRKITILEVLYEVGFNSKSSFNTLFKKYTGLTPSEFKKKSLH